MLSTYFLCLLVGLSAASDYAWKSGTEYQYQVRGRTLASLHQVDNQYTGVLINAQFTVRPKGEGVLYGRLEDMQYAQVHAKLPGGWRSQIPESQLSYRPVPMSNKPFEIQMKNGTVQELVVDKDIPNWEANIIKSVVSQIQIDSQGENMIKSRYNQAAEQQNSNSAAYKTMEDSVTGKCETLYDIDELPEYVLQSEPQLAPLPHLKADGGDFIDVVKTRNYSNCDERIVYHYGVHEMDDWEPAAGAMGDFFLKSSVSRAILSGSLKRHTIQSSVTTNKIVLKPTPNTNHNQKGLVVSQMNITLQQVHAVTDQPQKLSQPQTIGNLVYRYNSPYAASNDVREGSRNSAEHKYDSGSSSSREEQQTGKQQHYRQRRSVHEHQRQKERYDDSSSSSSSDSTEGEAQWQQDKPTMTSPPDTPLLPYTIGYKGQSIKHAQNINIVRAVQKLAKQIGEEVQQPSKIHAADTLAKFTILCDLIRNMNYQEVQEASRELYSLKHKQQRQHTDAWKSFRDAVAQAGTGPALLIIKDWLQSGKIRGHRAAAVIASAAHSARTPTDEYMRTFYTLATDDKIENEPLLNDTAILSFTELVRRVYVNKDNSHNQYPVHVFGTFYKQQGEVVENEYIPYLAKELKAAIRGADSHKIHVYIRALGNIGHRNILSVFEPYLEGDKPISQFQRLLMVVSMDRLVGESPNTARSVLYKIYQNQGEASEIRVAAVYQLMRTVPPASMLQRMAEATHTDTSSQVSGAVKSAIQTAAKLRQAAYIELANNARAAAALLDPTPYGLQYSKQYLKEYVVKEMNHYYTQHAGYLGSEDSIIPQGYMYSLRANMGGLRRQYMHITAMVSNVEDLFQVLDDQIEDEEIPKHAESKQQSPWASEKIAKLLNIEYEEREQLEGILQFGMGNVRRFFSFDNQTIEQLPQYLQRLSGELKHGKEFNYTKFYNPYEMKLSFPTAMGFPFVYSLDTPVLLSVHGEFRMETEPEFAPAGKDELLIPDTVNVTADMRVCVSHKTQAKLGFVTPFDHQHYVAGYDKQVQLYLPVRQHIDIDVENQQVRASFEPLDEQSDEVFHYSTWPYTATHDILQLKPISQLATTRTIHIREPQTYEHVFGKETGVAFRVNCTSEHKFMDAKLFWDHYQRHEGLSYLMSPLTEDSLVATQFSVRYEDDLSHADAVTFQMGWNNTYYSGKGQAQEPEFSQLYTKASELEDSEDRQQYFLKKAAAGINSVDAYVYDVSIQFEGKQLRQYNATFALGRSDVDKKSRVLFYFNKDAHNEKDHEICLLAENKIPNTNALDFLYALKFDPTSTSHMQLAWGEKCQTGAKVNMKTKMEQSQARQRYLQTHPMAKLCSQQMKEGDKQLHACRNMTVRANYLDHYNFDIQYENISPAARNFTYKLYRYIRHAGFAYSDEGLFGGHGQANHINIQVEFEPDFQAVNVSMETEHRQVEFNDIRVNQYAKAVFAVHPVFDVCERVAGVAQYEIFKPTCVIDQNHVETFDNRTYPIDLGKTWHVQMHYRVHNAGRQQQQGQANADRFDSEDAFDYAVLVRDSGNKQKDVKITLNNEKNYYGIDMIPASGSSHSGAHPAGQVLINQQPIKFDDQQSYDLEDDLIQVYALPNGDVKVEINDDFYVIYDGERVKLTATEPEQFRGEIRGLCGTFDGEEDTDFLTPSNCVLRNPYEFAASYAIIDASSQGPAKERQAKAKQAPCYTTDVIYSNVISPRDYNQQQQKNRQQHGNQHSTTSCSKQQTQYVEENNGQTLCFTIRPLPVCRSGCTASKKIVKNVEVHCVQKSNVSQLWKSQIEKGASPDFSRKSATKSIKIKVAQTCHA